MKSILPRTDHRPLNSSAPPLLFDFVLSDVHIPGMDGYDLARWIAGYSPSCRVMLLSTFDSDVARYPHSSRCELVRKPCDPEELASHIAESLRPRKQTAGLSGADDSCRQTSSRLLRQLVAARAVFDRTSDHSGREPLESDENTGIEVTPLTEQAKGDNRSAYRAYLNALQRYSAFVAESELYGEAAPLLEQAKRAHRDAYQAYLVALQRYHDFVDEGDLFAEEQTTYRNRRPRARSVSSSPLTGERPPAETSPASAARR